MAKDIQSIKYFTSDFHFGHRNICKFEDRPFDSVKEMDEFMIRAWNSVVKPEDTVYVLGDFSFHSVGKTQEIVNRLHGTKHLIWGNHDKENRNRLAKIFSSVYDQATMQLAKDIRVKLCHFPYNSTYDPNYKKYAHFRPADEGDWLIHGHVHSKWQIKPEHRCINVGVDVWDYKPVSHDKIIAIINKNTAK